MTLRLAEVLGCLSLGTDLSLCLPFEKAMRTAVIAVALADALGALDFDRRAAFVTMDIEGMSAPDAAVALGIPLGTAYSRLRLAREDFSAAVKRLRLKRGER